MRFSRLGLLLSCALGAWLFAGCQSTEPGAGSNTNWLKPCNQDAPCGDALSCVCGVCTAPCSDACPDLPNAVCVAPGSASARELCGPVPLADGMCLPACSDALPCGAGQLCSDGSCLQLASVDDSASACVPGAQVTLTAGGIALQARYGTLFGDALYLPVAYDAQPTDWAEPTTPTPLVATVTSADGQPVAGCAVRFIGGEGSGAAFADAAVTDEDGRIAAYWVAGAQRQQSLTTALVDQKGEVAAASLDGTAYANDEGSQSTDAAAVIATTAATLRLSFALPETSNSLRVALSAATYPHHAFYSAVSSDGFFAGLQNTSDLDALTDDVPDDDRILLASVWNLAEGDAQLLYGMAGLACGAHDQDLGGIRCTLGGAWQPGQDYLFELERTTLALGEAGPDYAALGYVTDACASAAGCTDYTLWFGSDPESDWQRVVAYRYQNGDRASWFGSFIQPYLALPAQTSCLATPRYDARFLPFVQDGAGFTPVPNANFSAAYLSWHNEVCANYAATPESNGFHLVTGGALPLGRPLLPNEPARTLTLP